MNRTNQDGVALIIVLSVLTMLLVIATPFLLQSKKDYQNATATAEHLRARRVAEAALEYAKLKLQGTHQGIESLGGGFKTPYWDAPNELRIDVHPGTWAELTGHSLRGVPYMGDPRGDLWSIEVRDEQGLINADTAPPFLWAALVGRATLGEDTQPSASFLLVDTVDGFKTDGGELVIGDEVVPYQQAKDDSTLR